MPLISLILLILMSWMLGSLIYQLGAQWSIYEQYHYGWAVPFLCLYLLKRRLAGKQWVCLPSRRTKQVAFLLLGMAALLYGPTRWLHESNPIWRFTSWFWAVEVLMITLCGVCLAYTPKAMNQCLWPLGIFLCAVPWPSTLESLTTKGLTRLDVTLAVESLSWLGLPLVDHGQTIETAHGIVGLDEACSGVQSLQVTLMLSLFLGELYRLPAQARAWLVMGGCSISTLGNVGRTTLLVCLAARNGVQSLNRWHDGAGLCIPLAALLILWALAHALDPKRGRKSFEDVLGPSRPPIPATHPEVRLWGLALVLGLWFCGVELFTCLWYSRSEAVARARIEWCLRTSANLPGARAEEVALPIGRQFRADEATQLCWRGASGFAGQAYYFRWLPGKGLGGRVRSHLAKTHRPERCLPALGWTLTQKFGPETYTASKLRLPFMHYVFMEDGLPVHVFFGCYEDGVGDPKLTYGRDDVSSRVRAAFEARRGSGQRWVEIALWNVEEHAKADELFGAVLAQLVSVQPTGQGEAVESLHLPMGHRQAPTADRHNAEVTSGL